MLTLFLLMWNFVYFFPSNCSLFNNTQNFYSFAYISYILWIQLNCFKCHDFCFVEQLNSWSKSDVQKNFWPCFVLDFRSFGMTADSLSPGIQGLWCALAFVDAINSCVCWKQCFDFFTTGKWKQKRKRKIKQNKCLFIFDI